jgi:hypothetical protein
VNNKKLSIIFLASLLSVIPAYAAKRTNWCHKITALLAFSSLVNAEDFGGDAGGDFGGGGDADVSGGGEGDFGGSAGGSDTPSYHAGEGESNVDPDDGRTNDDDYSGGNSLWTYPTYPFLNYPYWPLLVVIPHYSGSNTPVSSTALVIPTSREVVSDIVRFVNTSHIPNKEASEILEIAESTSISDSCQKILDIQTALKNESFSPKSEWQMLLNTTVAALNTPTCNSMAYSNTPNIVLTAAALMGLTLWQ